MVRHRIGGISSLSETFGKILLTREKWLSFVEKWPEFESNCAFLLVDSNYVVDLSSLPFPPPPRQYRSGVFGTQETRESCMDRADWTLYMAHYKNTRNSHRRAQ